jgi:YggT family protein
LFIIGNFLVSLAGILGVVLKIYMWLIVIRAVLSWFTPNSYSPVVQFLYAITEPVLSWARRILPSTLYRTGIDFSPLVVILIIVFLQQFLVGSLLELGLSLR